jgi:outer membrane lipoprotein SlyB
MTPHRHVRHMASTPRNADGIAIGPNLASPSGARSQEKGTFVKLPVIALASITAVAMLGGCASYEPVAMNDRPANVERIETGTVERIDLFREGQSSPTGLGAILGGVAGGVVGHQIGGGVGNVATTILGAVGGAVVGNHIEHANARDRYRITVRLDGSGRLEETEVGEGELRVGDRVRVVNNRVYRA